MELTKSFTFEAAHWLPQAPPQHKCRRLHGHSFKFTLQIQGDLQEQGWVRDFGDISKVGREIVKQLDHRLLNNIEGLTNPTAELIAVWIWQRTVAKLPQLAAVQVYETCTSACIYRGEPIFSEQKSSV